MREVLIQVAGPVAEVDRCPSAFWRGLRVAAFDGTMLDVADSAANAKEFTRPAGGAGPGGYPQARLVLLIECGTHVLIDAAIGGQGQGESTLAMAVAGSAGPDMLVLADRGMVGVPLWNAFRDSGAHLLWRLKRTVATKAEQILPDGTYLSRIRLDLHHQADSRRKGCPVPPPVLLRVVEYTIEGFDEVYRLGTSLLDPADAPADELAALYHARWDSEGGIGEIKTVQRGPGAVLASAYPDGVRQQIWAHLTVHHLTRVLMYHAAADNTTVLDPAQISFRQAQRLIRRDLSPAFSPL